MNNKTDNQIGQIVQRIINGLLFIVWGILALFILYAGTAHGRVAPVYEIMSGAALVSITLYPLALIVSMFSRSEKMLKLPRQAIAIQCVAALTVYVSNLVATH